MIENETLSVAGIHIDPKNNPVTPQHFVARTQGDKVGDWMLGRLQSGKAKTVVVDGDGKFDELFPTATTTPASSRSRRR